MGTPIGKTYLSECEASNQAVWYYHCNDFNNEPLPRVLGNTGTGAFIFREQGKPLRRFAGSNGILIYFELCFQLLGIEGNPSLEIWEQGQIFLGMGPVSRKSRKLSRPEKPFVKLRPAYSVKLVCSHVV